MLKYITVALLCASTFIANSQERPIVIEEDIQRNRLMLYAINQNETAYDVLVTVEGSGIRQSKGKPRWVHLPAASKVNVKSVIIERGKTPNCTYKVEANDSLSRRALKKPAVAIKIPMKKPLTVYVTEKCTSCDSIVSSLDASVFKYKRRIWNEETKLKDYLTTLYAKSKTPIDNLANPVVQLGGKYYIDIDSYDKLLEIVRALE